MGGSPRPAPVVVIGLGNTMRHDDAAGIEVVRLLGARARALRIAAIEQHGEPLALLELWEHAHAAVVIDAVRSGAAAGTIHRVEASARSLGPLAASASTHAVGLDTAIELARTLGRLPSRVVVFGLEGARFDLGRGLSDQLQDVLADLADTVLREAQRLAA